MDCELCELCNGNAVTHKYYEDDTVVIVDCATCDDLMLVFKLHGEATDADIEHASAVLNKTFIYGGVRTIPRRIPDHSHWHILDAIVKEPNGHKEDYCTLQSALLFST